MKVCIIPARGGSVRIPKKNIRPFHGKPIIEYSIQTATDSGLFSMVVVSTDDDEVAKVAQMAGAAVVWRDKDDGTKGTQEVAADVLKKMPGVDFACVLYPCAPLVLAEDLRDAFKAVNMGAQYAMAVGDPLADAGAFYFGRAAAFIDGKSLIQPGTAMIPLPAERVCDINTEADWLKAEKLYVTMKGANANR